MPESDLSVKVMNHAICPAGDTMIDAVIEQDRWSAKFDVEKLVADCHGAAKQAVPDLARKATVLFTDDKQLRALNLRFRGRDKATNVLSFPSGELEPGSLGDIALAYETILRESTNTGIALREHTAHMIIHGLLHLAGYDHETPDDAEQMEILEKQILSMLGIADPYVGEEPGFPAIDSIGQ